MYILRFFESSYEPCILQRCYDSIPIIPHKNDIVNFVDDRYTPYKVKYVIYNYPEYENDYMIINIMIEEVADGQG